MKILIAGNSQASCLKIAYERNRSIFSSVGDLYIHLVPGGYGPPFTVENDRLVPKIENAAQPAYAYPADAADQPVSSFDAIIISALGYVDGGFRFDNPIIRQGAMVEFSPFGGIDAEFVSQSCYSEIVDVSLREHRGFAFAKHLREHFDRTIIVQPFPYHSERIKDRPDWMLRDIYENPIDAYRFFCEARNNTLRDFCKENNLELLEYPLQVTRDMFTDPAVMRSVDDLHPEPEYGELVIEQIATAIRSPPSFAAHRGQGSRP